jgi:hypothetical protein
MISWSVLPVTWPDGLCQEKLVSKSRKAGSPARIPIQELAAVLERVVDDPTDPKVALIKLMEDLIGAGREAAAGCQSKELSRSIAGIDRLYRGALKRLDSLSSPRRIVMREACLVAVQHRARKFKIESPPTSIEFSDVGDLVRPNQAPAEFLRMLERQRLDARLLGWVWFAALIYASDHAEVVALRQKSALVALLTAYGQGGRAVLEMASEEELARRIVDQARGAFLGSDDRATLIQFMGYIGEELAFRLFSARAFERRMKDLVGLVRALNPKHRSKLAGLSQSLHNFGDLALTE